MQIEKLDFVGVPSTDAERSIAFPDRLMSTN